MAGVDIDRMRKGHEEQQKQGGDFVNFEVGETLLYIHPPCREADEWEPTSGRNYVPVVVHYGIGSAAKTMAVSLDKEKNPILDHPFMKALLKAQKKKVSGECPVAKALADGTITGESADEARAQTRFLWGVTALKYRKKSTDPWTDLPAKPGIAFVGKQIFDGIMEVFFDNGDISDPNGAVLVRVKRSGEKRTTKYEVKAEPSTLKVPYKLEKALRKALAAAMAEGGDCDLFRVTANMVKSTAELQALIDGVSVSREPDDDDDDDADDEVEETFKKGKKGKAAKAPPPDDDDDDDDDEPPAKPAKGKKAPPPPDDDDDDDDDDDADDDDDDDDDDADDDDDDDEPPAKPAKSAKPSKTPPAKPAKKAPPPDDDDDDDDADDDDDEPTPSAKPAKGAKAPPAKPEKKGGKKPADDDDDDDLGDLEAALEELDDDDDEPPAKPAKAAKTDKPKKK